MESKIPFVFFGSSEFSIYVLEELKERGILPSLLVTTPDKPAGRNLMLTPPLTIAWAKENNIPFLQPSKLGSAFTSTLSPKPYPLFVVASYGKIIPKEILDIPSLGTLNVHPSLLPKLRGPSPLQTAILSEEKTGATIILLDEKVDHGPIVKQEIAEIKNWPPRRDELEKILGKLGGKLLAEIF